MRVQLSVVLLVRVGPVATSRHQATRVTHHKLNNPTQLRSDRLVYRTPNQLAAAADLC